MTRRSFTTVVGLLVLYLGISGCMTLASGHILADGFCTASPDRVEQPRQPGDGAATGALMSTPDRTVLYISFGGSFAAASAPLHDTDPLQCPQVLHHGESIRIAGHTLRLDGTNVVVDNNTLVGAGQHWEAKGTLVDVRLLLLHPWLTYERSLSITNRSITQGLATGADPTNDVDSAVLLVTGVAYVTTGLNPFTPVLCLGSLVLLGASVASGRRAVRSPSTI
jgi:hypothetical protein